MTTTNFTCTQPPGTPKPPRTWSSPGKPSTSALHASEFDPGATAHISGSHDGVPLTADYTRSSEGTPLWIGPDSRPDFAASYYGAGTSCDITEA